MLKELNISDWNDSFPHDVQTQAINIIENGHILFLPKLAFTLLPQEQELLSPQYTDPKAKQISYDHKTDLVRGTQCSEEQYQTCKALMQRFSLYARHLAHKLLAPYNTALIQGRTSFRAVEIAGRSTSYRKDDTRLHVDAFPSAPIQGQRILRVFSNINPNGVNRIWRTGEPFADVVKHFFPLTKKQWPGSASLLKALKITKSYRTEYDHIMLQIHDRMKADLNYQKNVPQSEISLAPNTSWIVYTDHVSHAAMSGQHVLEQTFYLPVDAMVNQSLSPLRVLEKVTGRTLV